MSSTESFLRDQILTYPMLFPNRTAVLSHLFCVNGNGYYWTETGVIARVEYGQVRKLWNQDDRLAEIEAELETYEPFIQEILRPGMIERHLLDVETVEKVDERLKVRPAIENIYPQSDFALLMNVPENATAEWRALADEARSLAVEAGWVFAD